jgi:hypothetical protein
MALKKPDPYRVSRDWLNARLAMLGFSPNGDQYPNGCYWDHPKHPKDLLSVAHPESFGDPYYVPGRRNSYTYPRGYAALVVLSALEIRGMNGAPYRPQSHVKIKMRRKTTH